MNHSVANTHPFIQYNQRCKYDHHIRISCNKSKLVNPFYRFQRKKELENPFRKRGKGNEE